LEAVRAEKLKKRELIGEGGFGEVYRVIHSDWGPVAYKKLPVQFIRENDRLANSFIYYSVVEKQTE